MSTRIFEKNARVAFIGDSITHSSPLPTIVQDYYLRHLPALRVKTYNLGTGGDTAEGALARLESDILRCRPTEAVIKLGVNDITFRLYRKIPTEAQAAEIEERALCHLTSMAELVKRLYDRGIAVTLCSSLGRDELTPPADTESDEALRSHGATKRLYELYRENCRTLAPMLKGTVDYLTPFQALHAQLLAVKGPAIFRPDRTHATPLGQQMMARILLREQGLPVALPTAEMLRDGWCEAPYDDKLKPRFRVEQVLRNVRWVDPHQAAETEGLSLDERIAYWQRVVDERRGLAATDWAVPLYQQYLDNVRNEAALEAELDALTDALYE